MVWALAGVLYFGAMLGERPRQMKEQQKAREDAKRLEVKKWNCQAFGPWPTKARPWLVLAFHWPRKRSVRRMNEKVTRGTTA